MKVYIRNQQRSIRINQQRVRRLLRKALNLLGLQQSELSILFVNDRRMRILNLRYRVIDKTTDVLSFPQQSAETLKGRRKERGLKTSGLKTSGFRLVLGDIVINLSKAKKQASEHGLTFREELRRLIIHGLLHLVGYDHEKSRYQKRKMGFKERELLLALSYF
jgi:probable rRNA maturation factor